MTVWCVSVADESSDGTMFLHAEGPAQLLVTGGPCDRMVCVCGRWEQWRDHVPTCRRPCTTVSDGWSLWPYGVCLWQMRAVMGLCPCWQPCTTVNDVLSVWWRGVYVAGASGDGAVFLHADGCGGAVGESLASVDREAVDVSRLLSLFDWRGKVLVVCAMLSVRLAGHA